MKIKSNSYNIEWSVKKYGGKNDYSEDPKLRCIDSKYEQLKESSKKPVIKRSNNSSKTPPAKCYKSPSNEINNCIKKNVQIYACDTIKPTTVTTSKRIKSTKIVSTTKSNRTEISHWVKGHKPVITENTTKNDEWENLAADETIIRKHKFDTSKDLNKAIIKESKKAFSNSNVYFYIKPNTLYLGNTYKIATTVKSRNYNARAVLFIKVKQALKGDSCEEVTNLSFGQELEDRFTIKCLNYQGQVCKTKFFCTLRKR